MRNKAVSSFLFLVMLLPIAARGQSTSAGLEPSPQQLPDWLRQGKIRFARFDGGPIEADKAARASWGKTFTPRDQDVLTHLYGEYADRMIELLSQIHINFVWVTYSTGNSWEYEAAQRAEIREITRKLHARGIKVAAHMCAVSVFWESMFRDVPQSVRWILFDSQGMPMRYSGGRDPLRFLADVTNPGWVKYKERAVGQMIDDGVDAIFFDNTGAPLWGSDDAMAAFFTEVRQFIHSVKKSSTSVFTNFGLWPDRAFLNRYADFTYDEGWQEPGVWDGQWEVSNIRRTRLVRGMIAEWKPLVAEYSYYHQGDRATAFIPPRSAKLALAEAAAFGAAYTWDMEGPYNTRLLDREPAAMATWGAIGQYNHFFEEHANLYVGAANIAPLLVVVPASKEIDFNWPPRPNSPLADFLDVLAKKNVLFDLRVAGQLSKADLTSHSGVLVSSWESLNADEKEMVREFAAAGGKLYAIGLEADSAKLNVQVSSPAILRNLAANPEAQKEIIAKIRALASGTTQVDIGTDHVLANVTSLEQDKKLVIHVLNYAPAPATEVRVRLNLGQKYEALVGRMPILLTPDPDTPELQAIKWTRSTLELTLPRVDTSAMIVLQ